MIQPVKIQVRFSDLDILAHVNNSVYLTYFEMARVDYFVQLLGHSWDWKKFGVVLKKNEIEYHKSVVLYDEPEIQLFCTHVGTKSFILEYELRVKGEIYTTGSSVMVCFNSENQETIEVPDYMRHALDKIKR